MRTPLSPAVAIFALATTPGCAPDAAGVPEVIELLPFASSGAPLSTSDDNRDRVRRDRVRHRLLRVPDSLRRPERWRRGRIRS